MDSLWGPDKGARAGILVVKVLSGNESGRCAETTKRFN